MNRLSLAYCNAQKQSSWIDDPFDLKGFVTGVTPLSNQNSLENYAIDLVSSYGEFIGDNYELNFEKLSSPYQFELARLYIESIDREIEMACYGDNPDLNSDFLCAMLVMLKDNSPKSRANFAQITLKNIVIYYKETLQEILDNAASNLYRNEMNSAGYHCEQDMDHGDVVWRR